MALRGVFGERRTLLTTRKGKDGPRAPKPRGGRRRETPQAPRTNRTKPLSCPAPRPREDPRRRNPERTAQGPKEETTKTDKKAGRAHFSVYLKGGPARGGNCFWPERAPQKRFPEVQIFPIGVWEAQLLSGPGTLWRAISFL